MKIPVEYEFLKSAKGVIHVGASTGQERDIYAHFDLPVVWIEAIPEVYQELVKHLAKGRVTQWAYNYLITDKNNETYEFYVSNNLWSSSIFFLKGHKNLHPMVEIGYSIPLLSCTLKRFFEIEEIDLDRYDTLILDVQGAELLVLQGLGDLVDKFKFIRCEAADFELYKDGCQLKDLDGFFKVRGYRRAMTWKGPYGNDEVGHEYEALYERQAATEKAFEISTVHIRDPLTGAQGLFKVAAVTTTPRLGFQAHFGVLHEAFSNPKLFVLRIGGAFWEQGIQNGINILRNLGADYVITVDYDGIFTSADVNLLLQLAVRHPEADVIVPWQIGRGHGMKNLVVMRNQNGERIRMAPLELFETDITPVDMGAFGLTLIKVEALKRMPKPWFMNLPNEEGEWERGKTDADSYFFKKANKCGLKIFSANGVRIGHIEEMILWPGADLQPVIQDIRDYVLKGRPFELQTSSRIYEEIAVRNAATATT
jgi:FkbM family methyltransferase